MSPRGSDAKQQLYFLFWGKVCPLGSWVTFKSALFKTMHNYKFIPLFISGEILFSALHVQRLSQGLLHSLGIWGMASAARAVQIDLSHDH
jgi:hypothetical protein